MKLQWGVVVPGKHGIVGVGAAEAADNGEQRARRWSGGVLSGGEAKEAKCGRMSG
jgi:hypothetical protein